MKATDVKGEVLMIRMTRAEAVATIRSLANQIVANSPNAGRLETPLERDGRSFSIAVEDEPPPDRPQPDYQMHVRAARLVARAYFEIAAEAIGEDAVREKFRDRLAKAQR